LQLELIAPAAFPAALSQSAPPQGTLPLSLPSRRSSVVLREVPEGAILFCTETEVYFSLNLIGVRVWRLLAPESGSVDEVVSRIHEDYPDVSREQIATDVRGLIADLVDQSLAEGQAAS
jgi:coenzyme PQQ synthesis protein D (PqqD)